MGIVSSYFILLSDTVLFSRLITSLIGIERAETLS